MSRRSIPAVDWLLAGCAAVLLVVEGGFVASYGPRPVYLANAAIHAGFVPVLLLRRVRVLPSFVASYVLLAALAVLVQLSPVNLGVSPALLCAPLSLLAVTRWARNRWWGMFGLMLGVAGAFVSPLRSWGAIYLGVALHILIMVGCYLWASRQRGLAERHEAELAQQSRDHQVRSARAVEQERVLIAREVHDIVAHSLTVVQVQAATGLAIGGEQAARAALSTIRQASATALTEVRGLVGVLRHDDVGGPAGNLTRLAGIISQAVGAGVQLTVDLPDEATIEEWEQRWPAQVRLTVLRVTQEGLTNVVKHGGRRPAAQLKIEETAGYGQVVLSNKMERREGVPDSPAGSGYGLVGLHERLTLTGGHLRAGLQDDTFVLMAQIPLRQIESDGG